jgi:hypothetical protein
VKHRVIARSKRRKRRPTIEELQKLDEYFGVRYRHRCTVVPVRPIIWFAIYSSRRESVICRFEWGMTQSIRDAPACGCYFFEQRIGMEIEPALTITTWSRGLRAIKTSSRPSAL